MSQAPEPGGPTSERAWFTVLLRGKRGRVWLGALLSLVLGFLTIEDLPSGWQVAIGSTGLNPEIVWNMSAIAVGAILGFFWAGNWWRLICLAVGGDVAILLVRLQFHSSNIWPLVILIRIVWLLLALLGGLGAVSLRRWTLRKGG